MKEKNSVIMKVVDYIEVNLENKLALDDIAAQAGYSKYHLNRLFSKEIGSTIHKYIQKRRLTIAADKLVNTNKPLIEIAFEANYDSQQAFTLAFRQEYGCPPRIYRRLETYIPKQCNIHKCTAGEMRMAA